MACSTVVFNYADVQQALNSSLELLGPQKPTECRLKNPSHDEDSVVEPKLTAQKISVKKEQSMTNAAGRCLS